MVLALVVRRSLPLVVTATILTGGLVSLPAGPVFAATARAGQGSADRVDDGVDDGVERAEPRARPGKYVGHFYDSEGEQHEEFTFRVSRDGKTLKKFSSVIAVICSYYPPEVEVHPLVYPTVKISRRHTFRNMWEPNEDSEILLEGKFRGNRLVSGTLDYTVGICVRTGYLEAKRVGG